MKKYFRSINLLDNFCLIESLSNRGKYIVSKQFSHIPIKLKKDGYIPKSGLYLVRALASLDINGTCLDIGTGETGVIAQFLKLMGAETVYASDIDIEALSHAKDSSKISSDIHWLHSDIFLKIPDGLKFDFIVSNPPQLPSLTMEPFHDYGGDDGLLIIDKILFGAKNYLQENGKIYILIFDFLYDYPFYKNNLSVKIVSDNYGYSTKIINSYIRKVQETGKTFKNLDYIESSYVGFKFKKNGKSEIEHNVYIIEFAISK